MSKIDKTTNEQIAKHTPGNLVVRTTSVHRQFEITRAKDGRRPPEMRWDDYYVAFSGYFGSFGPHVFAAVPDMLEALREAEEALDNYADADQPSCSTPIPNDAMRALVTVRAAIAKAEGTP